MNNSANLIIKIFSLVFFLLSILGFISDWLPKERAFLETNTILNVIHMATAIGLSAFTTLSIEISIMALNLLGITYMLISEVGFMGINLKMAEQWDDVFSFNLLTYLQFGSGLTLCVSSLILKRRQHTE